MNTQVAFRHVKAHSDWRNVHDAFINAQFALAAQAIRKLKDMPNGKQKLKQVYGIQNEKGYPALFQ